jgi:hypothetical protein
MMMISFLITWVLSREEHEYEFYHKLWPAVQCDVFQTLVVFIVAS